jgi:hypothetical protein
MLAGRVQKVSGNFVDKPKVKFHFYTIGIEYAQRTGNCYRLKKVTNRTIVQIVCGQ